MSEYPSHQDKVMAHHKRYRSMYLLLELLLELLLLVLLILLLYVFHHVHSRCTYLGAACKTLARKLWV